MRRTIIVSVLGSFLVLAIPNGQNVRAAPVQDEKVPRKEKETSPKKETGPKKTKGGPRVSPLTKSECEKLGGVVRADSSCADTNHVCIIPYSGSSACVNDMSK